MGVIGFGKFLTDRFRLTHYYQFHIKPNDRS